MSAIFLLTKAFANWASRDDRFIKNVIERIFGNGKAGPSDESSSSSVKCTILLAVVDRLPGPHHAIGSESMIQEVQERQARTLRLQACPMQDHGYEGFAYCASIEGSPLFDDGDIHTGGTDTTSRSRRHEQSTIPSTQNQNTLAFHLNQTAGAPFDMQTTTTIVKMPLANTLFSNGQVSTMFVSEWRWGPGFSHLEKVNHRKAQHQFVTLPLNQSSGLEDAGRPQHDWNFGITDNKVMLTMPLIPLTPPREITTSMGNIIRSLGEVPASQELEQAVSQYFEENGIDPQAAAVWALIIPKEIAVKHSVVDTLALATIDPEHQRVVRVVNGESCELFSTIPFALLLQGAKLRRVTSGGGGWGNKAGLLSLEPEMEYGTDQGSHDGDASRFLDLDRFLDETDLVRNVASPGDYVRFYISPNSDSKSNSHVLLNGANEVARVDSIDFGVSPSTLDEMRTESALDTTEHELHSVHVFKNHFGAMSEVGFSFGQIKPGPQVQTKIDMPYARFSYQDLEEEHSGRTPRLYARQSDFGSNYQATNHAHGTSTGGRNTKQNRRFSTSAGAGVANTLPLQLSFESRPLEHGEVSSNNRSPSSIRNLGKLSVSTNGDTSQITNSPEIPLEPRREGTRRYFRYHTPPKAKSEEPKIMRRFTYGYGEKKPTHEAGVTETLLRSKHQNRVRFQRVEEEHAIASTSSESDMPVVEEIGASLNVPGQHLDMTLLELERLLEIEDPATSGNVPIMESVPQSEEALTSYEKNHITSKQLQARTIHTSEMHAFMKKWSSGTRSYSTLPQNYAHQTSVRPHPHRASTAGDISHPLYSTDEDGSAKQWGSISSQSSSTSAPPQPVPIEVQRKKKPMKSIKFHTVGSQPDAAPEKATRKPKRTFGGLDTKRVVRFYKCEVLSAPMEMAQGEIKRVLVDKPLSIRFHPIIEPPAPSEHRERALARHYTHSMERSAVFHKDSLPPVTYSLSAPHVSALPANAAKEEKRQRARELNVQVDMIEWERSNGSSSDRDGKTPSTKTRLEARNEHLKILASPGTRTNGSFTRSRVEEHNAGIPVKIRKFDAPNTRLIRLRRGLPKQIMEANDTTAYSRVSEHSVAEIGELPKLEETYRRDTGLIRTYPTISPLNADIGPISMAKKRQRHHRQERRDAARLMQPRYLFKAVGKARDGGNIQPNRIRKVAIKHDRIRKIAIKHESRLTAIQRRKAVMASMVRLRTLRRIRSISRKAVPRHKYLGRTEPLLRKVTSKSVIRILSLRPRRVQSQHRMTRRTRAARMHKLSLKAEARFRRAEKKKMRAQDAEMMQFLQRSTNHVDVNPWDPGAGQTDKDSIESIFEEVMNFDPDAYLDGERKRQE